MRTEIHLLASVPGTLIRPPVIEDAHYPARVTTRLLPSLSLTADGCLRLHDPADGPWFYHHMPPGRRPDRWTKMQVPL